MMNNQIRIFESPEFGRMRTAVDEEGNPLFCGKDVCDVLGYKRADLAVRQHVNPHDAVKRCVRVPCGSKADGSPAIKLMQMLFVNESGFYCLVFGSKLPIAQRFKHWVTSVVLPQIRKTGGYIPLKDGEVDEETIRRAEEILQKTLRNKDEIIASQKKSIAKQQSLIFEHEKSIAKQKTLIAEQETEIDFLFPKAMYVDNVLNSVSCYTTTQIAKELGMTAQELNRWLCTERIQYYQSGQYLLYAQYAHQGLAKSRTKLGYTTDPKEEEKYYEQGWGYDGYPPVRYHTHSYLVWTEKGRKFIHSRRSNN